MRNERRDDVLMTCRYLDLSSASDWSKQFLLSVITEAYASAYHQWLLCFAYPLFLLVPPCSPVRLFPLFPLVTPCFPLFPLFPLSPLVPLFQPCSPFFFLVPLVPLVPLCSPVPLFHLQFTTLNFWQSQISVNKKKTITFHEKPP